MMVEPRGQERTKGLPSHVLLTVPFNPFEQESSCPFTNGGAARNSQSAIKASSRTLKGLCVVVQRFSIVILLSDVWRLLSPDAWEEILQSS